jgi:hypothetical protein
VLLGIGARTITSHITLCSLFPTALLKETMTDDDATRILQQCALNIENAIDKSKVIQLSKHSSHLFYFFCKVKDSKEGLM